MLDSNGLSGKVALITGAGGDIGSATVNLMLARGARVVAVDRDAAALQRFGALGEAADKFVAIEGDVTNEASVQSFVAQTQSTFGRIDVLFNNAGIEGAVGPLTALPLVDFQRVLSVNIVGVFLCLKHVIPLMVATGGGAIINSSSVAGLTGTPGICAYNASKHAVIGLTRSAAAEWAAKGVRINSINPGPIASRMMTSIEEGAAPGRGEEMRERFTAMIPAGRYGTAEEVAALVAFLASDDARYLHGAIITVDGGFTVT